MPVLPDVASISVSPGRMSPRFSASTIIDSAGRSFTDPAGLLPSSLPRTTLVVVPGRRCRRTSGVLPTVDSSVVIMRERIVSVRRRRGASSVGKSLYPTADSVEPRGRPAHRSLGMHRRKTPPGGGVSLLPESRWRRLFLRGSGLVRGRLVRGRLVSRYLVSRGLVLRGF